MTIQICDLGPLAGLRIVAPGMTVQSCYLGPGVLGSERAVAVLLGNDRQSYNLGWGGNPQGSGTLALVMAVKV